MLFYGFTFFPLVFQFCNWLFLECCSSISFFGKHKSNIPFLVRILQHDSQFKFMAKTAATATVDGAIPFRTNSCSSPFRNKWVKLTTNEMAVGRKEIVSSATNLISSNIGACSWNCTLVVVGDVCSCLRPWKDQGTIPGSRHDGTGASIF
jgi:hypothetical protein